MKYLRPKPTREALVDLIVIDQNSQIWLSQAKNTAPEWGLWRRHMSHDDVIGTAHEELTRAGFIVHEISVLREGELFWAEGGKPRRMPHVLLLVGVNFGEKPATKDYYLQPFSYAEALKIRQQYSTDLKQLYDPTIDVIIRRQQL